MKRPPGNLWLLCLAGILLYLQNADGLRATSLIFAKTSTTTTTTTTTLAPETEVSSEPELEINNTVTKPPLTGIPQIDYIHDPNLPRELNGYNLTDYPFYSSLPEEIDFKCNGLHDGFYASVTHKCQVYHHCLYGTRYDFLCANFTAFDQKTFICHFASEVDCVNSPKYWHRNDALYEPTTTTTLKPPKTLEPLFPKRQQAAGGRRRRPLRRRRPQYEEYYDDMEEYEPEYDEDPRFQADPPRSGGRRRKRPQRPRRPQYEEDEYEYEDERYERRPYERRRNKDGGDRRYKESDDEVPERRPSSEGGKRKRPKEEATKDDDKEEPVRRPTGEGVKRYRPREDPVKSSEEKEPVRRPTADVGKRYRPKDDSQKDDDADEESVRRPTGEGRRNRPKEDRRQENRRPAGGRRPPADDEDYDLKSRKPVRKYKDDYEDTIEDRRSYDRPRKNNNPSARDDSAVDSSKPTSAEDRNERPRKNQDRVRDEVYDDAYENPKDKKMLVKPSSGSSVYDRPRQVPKIRPPVPLNEQDKYAYKLTKSTTALPADDEYYYDDEEEAKAPPPPPPPPAKKPSRMGDRDTRRTNKPAATSSREEKRSSGSRNRPVMREPDSIEYEDEEVPEEKVAPRPKPVQQSRSPPSAEEEYADYEEPASKTSKENAPPQLTSKERVEPVVRVVKRPFLPSRGGNPLSARGLQPVGAKAIKTEPITDAPSNKQSKPRESVPIYEDEQEPLPKPKPSNQNRDEESNERPSGPKVTLRTYSEEKPRIYSTLPDDRNFKPSPPLLKINERPGAYNPQDKLTKDFRPPPLPQSNFASSASLKPPLTTTTPRAKQPEIRNPLDINENEYDVTLNDALNPTLPNLPVRSFPTGFSSVNDYTWAAYQGRNNPPRQTQKFTNGGNTSPDLFPSGSGQIKSYQAQNFPRQQHPRHTQQQQYYSLY